MNFRQFRDFASEDDEAFLQNFDSPHQSNDILADLCKVELDKPQEIDSENSNQEMQEEPDDEIEDKNKLTDKARSKEKKKIFYRDKMAELMKPGEYIKQEYNYVAYTQYEQNKVPISKEEQLKRNRQSAKNSRQRKKEYVSILQKKNEQNGKMIDQLSYKLQQVTMQRDRLKEYNHHEIKNFLKSKAQAYQQLQKVVNSELSSQQQIYKQIQDMLHRFGASGTQRVAVTNYYMNEVIEVLISDIHKYFLNSFAFSQGFTASNPPKNIDNEVIKILDLDVLKINHIMERYRERFNKQANTFKTLTQQLYRIFKSIQNQGKIIELVFADLSKQLNTKRLAQLVLWFQQNKFCRQVKRIRKQWTDQLKSGQQKIEMIRKHTKPC